MPLNPDSAKVTERYRKHKVRLRDRARKLARQTWAKVKPSDIRGTFDAGLMTLLLSQLQREAARLSTGYVSAFITSELGHVVAPETTDLLQVGRARSGKPLRQAVDNQVIQVLKAIKGGMDPKEAIERQAASLERLVGTSIDSAAEEALAQAIITSPFTNGYTRSISQPACAACMAMAGTTHDGLVHFPVHPSCDCVAEPIVGQALASEPGQDVFNRLTREEQDGSLGPQAAQAVRDGKLQISDFAGASPQNAEPRILTQRSLAELEPYMTHDFDKRMERVSSGLTSTDPARQPSDDLDVIYKQARETEPKFRAFLDEDNELQRRLGAELSHGKLSEIDTSQHPQIIIAPLKDRDAATRKIVRKHKLNSDFSPEEITDINRATIAVDKLDDLPGTISELRAWANEQGWVISNFDNRFDPPTNLGYADLTMVLRAPNGHKMELQINVGPMIRAKEGPGHLIYEKWRALDTLPELTVKQRHQSAGLIGASRRVYRAALAEARKAATVRTASPATA